MLVAGIGDAAAAAAEVVVEVEVEEVVLTVGRKGILQGNVPMLKNE